MTAPLTPDFVLRFMRNLRLSKGRWAGKPMDVLPFQDKLTREVFELDAAGNRKRRTAVIGVGRKNTKTKLTAAWALALLMEEPGGEVVGAAAKRDQARLMLDAAKDFIKTSHFRGTPLTEFFKVRRNAIYFPEQDSVYKIIASEAMSEHGLNPHAVLADELHAWRDEELWYALTTAMGARENPLVIGITTAGDRPAGIWHDLYKRGKAIERGVRVDPTFLFRWWEADRDLPIDSRKAWRQANPALGDVKSIAFMEDQIRSVEAGDLEEYAFRRLHLNQPTTATERWVPYKRWVHCGGLEPDIPDDAEVFLGIDAALSRDTFAVSLVYLDGQEEPHAHVKVRAFTPDRDGDYIDPKEVETYVLGLAARYRIQEVRYDPAYMGLLASRLEDRGVPMEPMAQTSGNMARAAERLQRFILDGALRHGMDPTLDEHMSNVGVRRNDKGIRISKGKSGGPVDTVVALAMAIDAAVGERSTPSMVKDHFFMQV